jgi:hypothetical protein
MKKIRNEFCRDASGVSAVEFAIVAPLVFSLLFGIWNAGLALFARNGVQNAVESGARHATIFPRPTEQQIKDMVEAKYYGPSQGEMVGPRLTYGVENGAPVVTIYMSYTHRPSLPFVTVPPIVLEHQRTAYLAPVQGLGSR